VQIAADVAWHIASFRCDAEFGRYRVAKARLMSTSAPHPQRHRPPPGRRVAPPDDRLQRAIQYSEASVTESRSRSVLDTPRSMTTRCGAARRLANPRSVIPGRCEASNPESRDSGSGADAPSRNDGVWIFAEPVIGRAFARPPDLELRQRASHLSEEPGGIKN
jgi:hypothetical protein